MDEIAATAALEDRLEEPRTVTVEVESRTRGRTEEARVTFDPATPGIATVESESGSTYQVNTDDDSCNCMHYRTRGNDCRHIDAAHAAQGVLQTQRSLSGARPGQTLSQETIENNIASQQELDHQAEEARRAMSGELEDDGYFYADHPEEFENKLRRLANESLPYEYENVLNGSNITFGIELEFVDGNSDAIARELYREGICSHDYMVGYHAPGVRGKWKLERDGSVTSGGRGGELVSPVLQDTPETWRNIEKICEVARRHGARINYKCGAHVHMGMEPLDTARQRWRRFFNGIAGHEQAIYRFAGGTEGRYRENSTDYAAPFETSARQGARMRFSMNDEGDVRNLARSVSTSRYRGINLTNIPESDKPNTVEFRYFNGSLSPAQIQANVKMAAGVMMAAERARTQDVDEGPTPDSMKRRGNLLKNASNERSDGALMRFVDTFFTRKRDKDHILGVLAKNSWRR